MSQPRIHAQALARPRCFALVPAAGSGQRLGAQTPKQYLPLAGRPMIWHALAALCRNARIARVWVVLSADDAWWAAHDWSALGDKLHPAFCGGATRAESVANGLAAMAADLGGELSDADWALVHDAARPCLSQAMLDALLDALADDPVGGLLALPVADTLKRARVDARIAATLPREGLWQAQTPQMFRYGLLRAALAAAPKTVTDEAGAIERAGHAPRLVASDMRNFKVTYPADLALAEKILAGSQ